MTEDKNYVIGLDYGSDSVRAVLIDAANGRELASEVYWYPRWKAGRYCDPARNQFRQHPLDHIEGLETTVRAVVTNSGVEPRRVRGICVDTTGSSPVPVTRAGTPLCLEPGMEENPNAMMVLWKDHTALAEAEEINALARSWGGEDYTRYEGGIYSSEWFWAKILHVIREDAAVRERAYSWVEHCDLMTHLLTGHSDIAELKRSRCAAGHKAMWHEDWDGLPPRDFLVRLHPHLAELRDRLYRDTYTSDTAAGHLSPEWAGRLGLTTDTVVAVGTFDAHAGAIGAGITENCLVRVMGTSTCDMMVASPEVLDGHAVRGICGQVDGSIIPGMIGLEAGQSAFGDVLAWFKSVLLWPTRELLPASDWLSDEQRQRLADDLDGALIRTLSDRAAALPLSDQLPTALDWVNGRRTPDADQSLKSAIMNISLGTGAPELFQALVHAICFGSRKIVERFESEGVRIDKVIGIGGVARKSPYIMQTLANVLDRPIAVATSDYAPALGAAIYAAVAAGLYPDILTASARLASRYEAEYQPDPEQVRQLRPLFRRYEALGQFVEEQTSATHVAQTA
ncbi:L-ribulokinase [Lewinella marina]|uniref:Ribulokinase n=1 Tax=Neolewinella marina TaxID=438751 RepID=A0A2G0CB06_9BACT|nr:ribulokinase [Neolewinella marina]NJB84276.1 L-ribulokinase [Neolewinella marina]PHK97140.1 ribulokinase [Neolewinella marina]